MDELREGVWGQGLLLEYVFIEFVTVVQRRINQSAALRIGQQLRQARELRFVQSADVFEMGLRQFQSQNNLGLSFIDAAVVATALHVAEGHVASFDLAFSQVEGIKRVP